MSQSCTKKKPTSKSWPDESIGTSIGRYRHTYYRNMCEVGTAVTEIMVRNCRRVAMTNRYNRATKHSTKTQIDRALYALDFIRESIFERARCFSGQIPDKKGRSWPRIITSEQTSHATKRCRSANMDTKFCDEIGAQLTYRLAYNPNLKNRPPRNEKKNLSPATATTTKTKQKQHEFHKKLPACVGRHGQKCTSVSPRRKTAGTNKIQRLS